MLRCSRWIPRKARAGSSGVPRDRGPGPVRLAAAHSGGYLAGQAVDGPERELVPERRAIACVVGVAENLFHKPPLSPVLGGEGSGVRGCACRRPDPLTPTPL